VHPGLFLSKSGEESEPIAAGQFDWNPDKSPTGPVSVIISSADKTVYVYRNGMEIGVISPGATLIFTDRPVDPTTQSPPNFQILVA
jgi:hypothetical protein